MGIKASATQRDLPTTHSKRQRIDSVNMPRKPGSSDMRFQPNNYSLETTSDEAPSEVQSLLRCPTKITVARSLEGREAQTLIDFLDGVLAGPCLDGKSWQRCLRLLSKICKARRILPTSYLLQREPVRIGSVHFSGGSADVSDGEYMGSPVAIKYLKIKHGDHHKIFKFFCREVIAWKHLSHPNILPLKGVSVSIDTPRFSILSEWMPNGDVMKYTRLNPEANRLRLLSEAASGVAYLHRLSIAHGDIKGVNIFVDNTGTARVGDFGFVVMTDLSTFLSETAVTFGGTFCWMSPELLDPARFGSSGRPTRASDSYAFGMVIYEVLTGLRPFHHLRSFAPVHAVLGGERPEKPREAESLGFSSGLWELVQSCWSESGSARPTTQQLLDHLSSVSLGWVPPLEYPVRIDVQEVGDASSFQSSGGSTASSTWEE